MEKPRTANTPGRGAFVMSGWLEALVQVLIVLSLLAFSVETLPDLDPAWRHRLGGFETFCVAVFTLEYGVRAWYSRPRRSYLLGFFGITDLLAILPYYIGLGVDARSLRAFRLLRLFRVFKLVRYSQAVQRFRLALAIAREEIILFLAATAILLYLGSVGIYYFESTAQPEKFGSVFDCLWWAVATLTTVGYGDVYPVTAGGKVFTFVLLLVGLGVISVPAGLVASALAKARRIEEDRA